MICHFVIAAHPPRTKKTSNRVVRIGNFTKVLPSAAFCEWQDACLKEAVQTKYSLARIGVRLPIRGPVHIRALVFRHALVGDACGYYQAIGDFLQTAGFIENDQQIEFWDGSRLLKDNLRPRIEIEINEAGPEQVALELAGGVYA